MTIPYTPTPSQIRRACEAIRAEWSPEIEAVRRAYKQHEPHVPGENRGAVVCAKPEDQR